MENNMYGYVIEDKSAEWDKRFWIDIPSVGVREFGSENRARIFFTKEDAEIVNQDVIYEYSVNSVVTSRSKIYPSWRI